MNITYAPSVREHIRELCKNEWLTAKEIYEKLIERGIDESYTAVRLNILRMRKAKELISIRRLNSKLRLHKWNVIKK